MLDMRLPAGVIGAVRQFSRADGETLKITHNPREHQDEKR